MLISEVLKRKGATVVTMPAETPVGGLLKRLAEHHIGALVVSPDGVSVAGIVSERDVVRRLVAHGPALLEHPISEIMTAQVRTCSPTDTVEQLMVLMTVQRFRHVPVVDFGRLTGIVSIGDVVKQRLEELQTERDQLTAYISS
jgi:CBS domain-containing protein